jgi:hypothetical protein
MIGHLGSRGRAGHRADAGGSLSRSGIDEPGGEMVIFLAGIRLPMLIPSGRPPHWRYHHPMGLVARNLLEGGSE